MSSSLWAPWRMAYIRGLESKAEAARAGGEPSGSPNFLADYWAHPERDQEQHVIVRDSRGMILLNRYPYTNGHLLVALGEAQPSIDRYAPADRAHFWQLMELAMDLCRRMTAFLDHIGSQAGPNPRTLRTANTTWLFFRHGWGLVFKIPAGVVDIYPAKLWPSEDRSSWTAQPPQGFEAATDGEGNLVLRWSLSERPDYDAMLVDGNIGPIEDALRACDAASRWIDERTCGRMSN